MCVQVRVRAHTLARACLPALSCAPLRVINSVDHFGSDWGSRPRPPHAAPARDARKRTGMASRWGPWDTTPTTAAERFGLQGALLDKAVDSTYQLPHGGVFIHWYWEKPGVGKTPLMDRHKFNTRNPKVSQAQYKAGCY